jgi:hypothetical protein
MRINPLDRLIIGDDARQQLGQPGGGRGKGSASASSAADAGAPPQLLRGTAGSFDIRGRSASAAASLLKCQQFLLQLIERRQP